MKKKVIIGLIIILMVYGLYVNITNKHVEAYANKELGETTAYSYTEYSSQEDPKYAFSYGFYGEDYGYRDYLYSYEDETGKYYIKGNGDVVRTETEDN